MPDTRTAPRIACYTDESYETPDGRFKVISFREDEAGYWTVNDWPTLPDAQAYAAELNERLSNDPLTVLDIYASSMRAPVDRSCVGG